MVFQKSIIMIIINTFILIKSNKYIWLFSYETVNVFPRIVHSALRKEMVNDKIW